MHGGWASLVAGTGGAALAVLFVSQIFLIFAYRAYYARRFGVPCDMPVFRLGRTGPTLVDTIRHLEFRDPLGWRLRAWLILYYLAQLVFALSLAGFLVAMVAGV